MSGVRPRCVCGCGRRSANRHHVIYAQEVKRQGGSIKDRRNLVWIAFECHGAHHNGSRRLELSVLPDSVFEFAAELMGAAGYDWLRRFYRGKDARLEALLSV